MSDDTDAIAALGDFTRFPRWMWRNDVVVDFVTWLRTCNGARTAEERRGWYGLDLGELNLGQLVRQEYGAQSYLVGFTTHIGTVTAAREWDQPAEYRQVRPSLPQSWERLFHDAELDRFLLLFDDDTLRRALAEPRLERAIGVVYKPETERASHYFKARLTEQFDAVIHFDQTEALAPLEYTSEWQDTEAPETYPFAV